MTSHTLPQGYAVRVATMHDLQEVYDLLVYCERAEFNRPDYIADYVIEDLQALWQAPNFDLTRDTWVVTIPDGSIIAYMDVDLSEERADINPNSCVHPSHIGRGISTYLLRAVEARSLAYAPTGSYVLLNSISYANSATQKLLEQEGFNLVSQHRRMEMTLHEAPPQPIWPEGVTVRTLMRGQDEHTFLHTINEAFSELPRYTPHSFDEWQSEHIARADFDPTLWYLALAGNEVAGCTIGYLGELGWIQFVAVRRPWRHKGLGLALLYNAFGEFYRRGRRNIGLNVNADNPTGAVQLYDRAGMHIYHQFDTYEKKLR